MTTYATASDWAAMLDLTDPGGTDIDSEIWTTATAAGAPLNLDACSDDGLTLVNQQGQVVRFDEQSSRWDAEWTFVARIGRDETTDPSSTEPGRWIYIEDMGEDVAHVRVGAENNYSEADEAWHPSAFDDALEGAAWAPVAAWIQDPEDPTCGICLVRAM